jgi:hypothetical protein
MKANELFERLSDAVIADDAVWLDEVERLQVVVVEGAPDFALPLERDRVVDVGASGPRPVAAQGAD